MRRLEDLALDELRHEVRKCHEHMQRCYQVLCGERNVKAVELVDVLDSIDLELFYKCRSMAATVMQQRKRK
jgi:septation ring formation regulator EzrA